MPGDTPNPYESGPPLEAEIVTAAAHPLRPITPMHVQAAKASWIAPLLAILLNAVIGRTSEELIVTIAIGVIAGIMVVGGLIFALWAIVGALIKGPRRVLIPAGIGLLSNGLLVYLVIYTVLYIRRAAE